MSNAHLTVAQVAERLGLTPHAVWKAVERQSLRTSGMSKRRNGITISEDEVERYRLQNRGRQGPITFRCARCQHGLAAHPAGANLERICNTCGDTYTLDARITK